MISTEFHTLAQAKAALSAGQVSSVELTDMCLAAAQTRNEELNCFVHIEAEQARAGATAADAARTMGGAGVLNGVPLAHKDCFYRTGVLSTCGSPLRASHRPQYTASVLGRLDAAGAVDLGGLHMSEWAFGPTGHNHFHGPCHNPWDRTHITGGSSSGSGASVAAGIVFGALGTDTGGSVRLPAACCGLTGIKPTLGRVSRFGLVTQCHSLEVAGPLARTAEDCALLLGVIAGFDPKDGVSAREPVPNYAQQLTGGIKGLRIAVPQPGTFPFLDGEVQALLSASLTVLEEVGAHLVEVSLPDLGQLDDLAAVVMACESASIHGAQLRHAPDSYSPQVRERIEQGFSIPAPRYLDAFRLRSRYLNEMMFRVYEHADLLHMPVLPGPVPTIEETDVGDGARMHKLLSRIQLTRPISYLGLPAVSVPGGFTDNGLPNAFQLVGRPFAEGTLLRAAHTYQQYTDWHLKAPG